MAFMTLDRWKAAIRHLLPPGKACSGDNFTRLMESFAPEALRLDEAATSLHEEIDPRTTASFLTEWENTLGLPDTDISASVTTDAERRAAIISRLASVGGQSKTYLTKLCYTSGFTVILTEGTGEHRWYLYVKLVSMSAGLNTKILQNIIKRYKPAHLVVVFDFADNRFRAGSRAGTRLVTF